MTDLLQRLKGESGREGVPTESRVTLAAFGKHPGWDDHIPGIGVETEALAEVKQALYVRGIGTQIDSGAWERLEPEKRLEGYDHTFLWLWPSHTILGQLWSSRDGKGRAKYPMVMCIDAEGVSPGLMLTSLLPGLERLREACRATGSASQVIHDCRAAQEQLRLLLSQRQISGGEAPSIEARRRFLARAELGPDRCGLLRALHELSTAPALGSTGKSSSNRLRSLHVRLPLAADSRDEALMLWSIFLKGVIPQGTPLLLIARSNAPWFDIVIGPPVPDDFFCLQASPKALPLATEIPYQLAPDLGKKLQELEALFLGEEASPANSNKASSTKPPPLVAPPPGPAPSSDSSHKSSKLPLLLGGGVIALLALAGVVFFLGPQHSTQPSSANVTTIPNQTADSGTAPQVKPQPETEQDRAFRAALAAAQEAQARNDFSNALVQAELAQKARPADPVATKLLNDVRQHLLMAQQQGYEVATNAAALALVQGKYEEATNQAGTALAIRRGDPAATVLMAEAQNRLVAAHVALDQERSFAVAMNEGKAAFERKDYTTAIARTTDALGIKKDDPKAMQLKADAQNQMDLAATEQARQQKYEAAMKEAQSALGRKDYSTAKTKADEALGFKKDDPTAIKLRADVQNQMGLAAQEQERQQKYDAAMKEGQSALKGKDYSTAKAKADEALGFKKDDPTAIKLRADAQNQMELAATEQQRQQKYEAAMADAKAAFDQKDYTNAMAKADLALKFKENDPDATQLKSTASENLDLGIANSYFSDGRYSEAFGVCQKHPGANAFATLSQSIGTEQKSLQDATQSFSQGDYSFIAALKGESYGTKPPFLELTRKATDEQKILQDLQAMKQTNGWQEVKNKLADSGSVSFATKQPFDELRKWADSQSNKVPESPEKVLQRLDTEFEVMLVWFDILSPTDPKIQTAQARKERPFQGAIGPQKQSYYLERAGLLETEYRNGGWLDKNDRARKLKKLKEAIRYAE
jgi:hypothetical protein